MAEFLHGKWDEAFGDFHVPGLSPDNPTTLDVPGVVRRSPQSLFSLRDLERMNALSAISPSSRPIAESVLTYL